MKKVLLFLVVFVVLKVNAQNYGRVVVYTNLNQAFMVSLNGIRVNNNYSVKTTFEFAEENEYKVRVWFQGAQYPVNFVLQNTPGYESVYLLNKDQYGAYTLNLLSKVVFGANNPSVITPTTAPTVTATATPTVPVIKEMDEADFISRYNTIKKESFDDGKLSKAKFVFATEYFSSSQVARVVGLFSFETKKVDFAKFAYKKTIDKKNYYKVVDALTFDSYKKELEEWIKKNP